jgi:hypothetical protein
MKENFVHFLFLIFVKIWNICNQSRKISRRDQPSEKVIEERQNARLGMEKRKPSTEAISIYSTTITMIISTPSPQVMCKISIKDNPISK